MMTNKQSAITLLEEWLAENQDSEHVPFLQELLSAVKNIQEDY